MRAGSLSDPRVVALLRTHFVCVHMPELVTRDLIADPRDAELLERYDRELRARRPAYLQPGLHGGEREVFLAPDGELLDIFLSLHEGEGQCRSEPRATPQAAVENFFARAARALARVHGEAPGDLEALLAGRHPEVARMEAAPIPEPPPPKPETTRLVVWARNDLPWYEGLVARDHVDLGAAEVRGLLPPRTEPGTRWRAPRELAVRLARAAQPRGAGVLLAIPESDVDAWLELRVRARHGARLEAELRGRLALRAREADARGRRATYRPFRSARVRLAGRATFDLETGALLELRLAGAEGVARYAMGGGVRECRWEVAILLDHRARAATSSRKSRRQAP